MLLINGILAFCAIEHICLFVNGGETIAQKNHSFDDETYGPLFSSDGYPKPGDMPMLNRKVFRGMRVSIIEHPYIVSIRRRFAHHFTGTLLSKNIVISIAHPIINIPLSEFNVVAGENYCDRGATALTIVLLVVHQNFDPYTLTGDLALMKTFESVNFKVSIKPILRLYQGGKTYENKNAFVTGWGRCDMTGRELCLPRSSKYFRNEKMDPMLRTVTFVLNEQSHKTYCEGYKRHGIIIKRGMLCLGVAREENPVSPCMAVPGAPLVVSGELLGLQSWGFGCGYNHDLPLIYTDVGYYRIWILYNTNILKTLQVNNLTQLFEATRARILTMWLKKTRAFLPSHHQHSGHELQPTEIDRHLARLKGNVFDIRDFINRRELHESKQNLYSLIRTMNERADKFTKIMQDNANKKIFLMKMMPFLNQRIKDNIYSNDYGQVEVKSTENTPIFKDINDYGQEEIQNTEDAQIFKDINDNRSEEVQNTEDAQIEDGNDYGQEDVQSADDTQVMININDYGQDVKVQSTEGAQIIIGNDSGKVAVESTENAQIVTSNNGHSEDRGSEDVVEDSSSV